jgi:hypothetical protein
VTSVKKGDHVHPALHARMPQLSVLPVTQDQFVHCHPRNPRPRGDARWHVAIFRAR